MIKIVASLILAGSLLSGCNTIAGMGEDITGAARAAQGGY